MNRKEIHKFIDSTGHLHVLFEHFSRQKYITAAKASTSKEFRQTEIPEFVTDHNSEDAEGK